MTYRRTFESKSDNNPDSAERKGTPDKESGDSIYDEALSYFPLTQPSPEGRGV